MVTMRRLAIVDSTITELLEHDMIEGKAQHEKRLQTIMDELWSEGV